MATDPSDLINGLLSGGYYQSGQQQTAANQQALQIGAMKIAAVNQQAQQEAQYQSDVGTYFKNPTPQALASLVAKYPDQYQALKASAGVLNDDQTKNQLTMNGITWNLAKAGPSDALKSHVQSIIDADKAAGRNTDDAQQALEALNSPDPATQQAAAKSVEALTRVKLSALGAKGFEIDPDAGDNADQGVVVGNDLVGRNSGKVLYHGQAKPTYEKITNADGSESLVQVGGGDQTSAAGGAAGSNGDVSRLLNSDAGGGYVPDSVKTLGQFVTYGKSLNAKGAKSSSAGTYQINGSTMAQFAPKVLGPNWQSVPFNADSQDKVGQAIFDWAKQQPNPAAALKARWVSLSAPQAAQLVQGDWEQAKPVIAQGETGGGAGASASNGPPTAIVGAGPAAARPGVKVLYTSKPADAGQDAATVEFYGQKVAAGGDLPQLGMGKQAAALRQAILTRSAQIQQGQGMTGADSNLLHADVKTATTALAGLQKTRNSLDPYLQTFDGASAQVRQLAPKAVGGSIPIFNRWIQAGRTGISGDPAVSKFNVAINAVANENAKIMSGASGGAVSSDSARHEAMSLINNAQTLDQLNSALDQMHTDTQIRVKSLDDRQAALRSTIAGKGQGPTRASGVPAGFKILSVR